MRARGRRARRRRASGPGMPSPGTTVTAAMIRIGPPARKRAAKYLIFVTDTRSHDRPRLLRRPIINQRCPLVAGRRRAGPLRTGPSAGGLGRMQSASAERKRAPRARTFAADNFAYPNTSDCVRCDIFDTSGQRVNYSTGPSVSFCAPSAPRRKQSNGRSAQRVTTHTDAIINDSLFGSVRKVRSGRIRSDRIGSDPSAASDIVCSRAPQQTGSRMQRQNRGA